MLIERIPEWHLNAADDAAIAGLLAVCFPTDFGGRSFFVQRHHLRLVVRDEGAIIGHMALTLRAVQLGGRLTTVAGLAEVATHPAHRGRGIAAALLQAAIRESRASPAEHLLLFGAAGIYQAAGFRTVFNKLAHVASKGSRVARLITTGEDHLMVLQTGDRPWPEDELVDLRGPMF